MHPIRPGLCTHLRSGSKNVWSARGLQAAQTVDNRILDREDASDLFGIDQVAIGFDLKDAAHRFDQVRIFLQLAINFFRQTDGTGEIPSTPAVFNGDLHCLVSLKR